MSSTRSNVVHRAIESAELAERGVGAWCCESEASEDEDQDGDGDDQEEREEEEEEAEDEDRDDVDSDGGSEDDAASGRVQGGIVTLSARGNPALAPSQRSLCELQNPQPSGVTLALMFCSIRK